MIKKSELAVKNRRRGKTNEKKLSKILDASRVGIFGGEDLTKGNLSIEAKSRKQFVAEKWMEQAERNSKGKIPIVIVHIHGRQHENDFVIIRLKNIKGALHEFD